MAVNLSPVGGVAGQFFDNNGVPLAGGKIYTYAAGTTTNQATYTSVAGVVAHTNPIILDGGGRVPNGEIWLTDGLQYKFVTKTSTDVLIGTYDNIIGINSNFVNFLTETEVQTATAGQTIFTLTTMQYQPGTNNLSVFVDGVNQIDGSGYSYVETSSSVVTFTAGLHVGALVKFTTAQTLSGGVTDASLVTYEPPFLDSVATTVENKLAQTVSVMDFGAVGNGVADDTAAINDALSAVYATKKALYFPAGIYLYDGGGVLGNGNVMYGDGRNASTIRSRTASPTSGYLIKALGYGSGLRSLRFDANVAQTNGSYVWLSGPESFIDDFDMNNDINGVLMTGNVSRIRHGRFQDGATNATRIRAEGGDNSQSIDDVLMGAQSPQVSFAGIRVRNSSALMITNTSVIQQGYGLLIDPTTSTPSSNTADGNVFSLYANNCFFDNSSGNAVKIAPTGTASAVRCRFANCWMGSSAGDGVLVNNAGSGILHGMYFDSCHMVLNGTGGAGAGLTTVGAVADIVVNGGLIANNIQGVKFNSGTVNSRISNATVGSGGGLAGNSDSGIVLSSGTNNIVVTGNTVINNTASGVIATGTALAYLIADNFISGNGTNLTVTATANRVVRNNVGVTAPDFATGSSLVPLGGTSVVVSHNLGVAPAANLISISPTSGWGNNPLYVDTTTITTTQFTVRAASAVPSNYDFTWNAKINNN